MHFYSLVALSTSCYRSKVTKRDCLNGKLYEVLSIKRYDE